MNVQDSLTNIENNTAKVNAEKAATRKGETSIDQDGFLQLLMMQLKNQDPMNPMDTKDFISQQAQFTSISELQKLNKNVVNSNQIMNASALIGKEVSLTNPDNSSETITGTVSEIRIGSAGAGIVVNDKQYSVDSIKTIKNN